MDLKEHLQVIKENCVDLISEKELVNKLKRSLKKSVPLRLKVGFDPTARDIHLGHTVLLRKLRKLQELGHIVYLIIGDFTARIGDPSGRKDLRPVLSEKEIRENAKTYTSQAFKILDKKKTRVVFNSRWYRRMSLSDFFPLLSSYTVARMIERDDFSSRLKEGKPLSMLEFIYPLIQGYDSVKIKADIEFGGTDQKFNLIVGRHLQSFFGQEPQIVVTLPLLVGLDGKNKMSKSLGNYVGITESAKEMFGKIMSIPDEIMEEYFRLLTDINLDKIKSMHPKEAKLLLAQTIVSQYHSSQEGVKEKEEFERVFSQRKVPSDINEYRVNTEKIDLIEILPSIGVVGSKNEVRRLLSQRGIKIIIKDGEKCVENRFVEIPSDGIILKVGKKRFVKLVR